MTETAKSIRLSLKQQLNKESKTNFNLLRVPKGPELRGKIKKTTKLRLRKLQVPSPQSLLPKCIFSRGPIAYGLVPRPKAPEGYEFDLKSSKQRSRRSMMARNPSSNGSFTERVDSSRSMQSISSCESSESISIRDLQEDSDDEPTVFSKGYITKPPRPTERDESMAKSCPNLVLPSTSPGRTGRRSCRTLQSSSSVKSLNCPSSSLNERATNQDAYFRSPSLQRVHGYNNKVQNGSARSLQHCSSTRSMGNSVLSDNYPKRLSNNRTMQSYPSMRSMSNSASSIGGRQESAVDNYPLRLSIKRDINDVEDELDITLHRLASPGRRKTRGPSAASKDQAHQQTVASPTATIGRSARKRNGTKARTGDASECRSWVLWTDECDE